MGSSGGGGAGGGGGLAAMLQGMPPRDQLAMLQSMPSGGGGGGQPPMPYAGGGGGGQLPMPYAGGGGQPPTPYAGGGGGGIGLPGDPRIAAGIAANMAAQGGPQRTNFGRPDPNDPRYASRLAEGAGPKAGRPDMSAMMNARAANPPAPPPLPYGIPLPRS